MTQVEEQAEEYLKQDGTNGEKAFVEILKKFPILLKVKDEEEKETLVKLLCNYSKEVYKDGWLSRDGAEHRKGIWFVTPEYEIECVGLNSCAGYVNPLFVGDYKSDCIAFIKKEIDGSKSKWHDKELETTIKNYQKVINELMGTQLTDTEEVSRLINIAYYQKWEELYDS